jgi:hypothetical protein
MGYDSMLVAVSGLICVIMCPSVLQIRFDDGGEMEASRAHAEEMVKLAGLPTSSNAAHPGGAAYRGLNFWRCIWVLPEHHGTRSSTLVWHTVTLSPSAEYGVATYDCTCPKAKCGHIGYMESLSHGRIEQTRLRHRRKCALNACGSAEVIQVSVSGTHSLGTFHPGRSVKFIAKYAAYSPYHGTVRIVTGVVKCL